MIPNISIQSTNADESAANESESRELLKKSLETLDEMQSVEERANRSTVFDHMKEVFGMPICSDSGVASAATSTSAVAAAPAQSASSQSQPLTLVSSSTLSYYAGGHTKVAEAYRDTEKDDRGTAYLSGSSTFGRSSAYISFDSGDMDASSVTSTPVGPRVLDNGRRRAVKDSRTSDSALVGTVYTELRDEEVLTPEPGTTATPPPPSDAEPATAPAAASAEQGDAAVNADKPMTAEERLRRKLMQRRRIVGRGAGNYTTRSKETSSGLAVADLAVSAGAAAQPLSVSVMPSAGTSTRSGAAAAPSRVPPMSLSAIGIVSPQGRSTVASAHETSTSTSTLNSTLLSPTSTRSGTSTTQSTLFGVDTSYEAPEPARERGSRQAASDTVYNSSSSDASSYARPTPAAVHSTTRTAPQSSFFGAPSRGEANTMAVGSDGGGASSAGKSSSIIYVEELDSDSYAAPTPAKLNTVAGTAYVEDGSYIIPDAAELSTGAAEQARVTTAAPPRNLNVANDSYVLPETATLASSSSNIVYEDSDSYEAPVAAAISSVTSSPTVSLHSARSPNTAASAVTSVQQSSIFSSASKRTAPTAVTSIFSSHSSPQPPQSAAATEPKSNAATPATSVGASHSATSSSASAVPVLAHRAWNEEFQALWDEHMNVYTSAVSAETSAPVVAAVVATPPPTSTRRAPRAYMSTSRSPAAAAADAEADAHTASQTSPRFASLPAYHRPAHTALLLRIGRLAAEFTKEATEIGKTIISEVFLPLEKKTIRPITAGGVAGGLKFIENNIFFKFSVDEFGIYDGDEFAMKAAKHDLRGLHLYMHLALCGLVHGVHFPLSVLISWRGFRVTANTVLPLGNDTLVYGSADGSRTIVCSDAQVAAVMKEAAAHLNVKGHNVVAKDRSHRQFLYACGDIECHRARDSRVYVVDTHRIMPPTVDETRPRGAFLYRLFRAEFVRTHSTPLCSDALSRWGNNTPDEFQEHKREVVEASERLRDEVVPAFAATLQRLYDTDASDCDAELGFYGFGIAIDDLLETNEAVAVEADGAPSVEVRQMPTALQMAELVVSMHRRGINVRYLGLLRRNVTNVHLRRALLSEMVARHVKRSVWYLMRETHSPLEFKYFDACYRFYRRHVFGSLVAAEAQRFWTKQVKEGVLGAFGGALSDEESAPDYDLRHAVDLRLVFERLAAMTGVDFGTYEDFMTGIFMCPTLHPVVDDLPVVRFFEAFVCYTRGKEQIAAGGGGSDAARNGATKRDAERNWFRECLRKFLSVLESHPSDTMTLNNMALLYQQMARAAQRDGDAARAHRALCAASARLQAALWLDGDNDKTLFNYAMLLLSRAEHAAGNDELSALLHEAHVNLRRLLDAHGDDEDVRFALGQVMLRQYILHVESGGGGGSDEETAQASKATLLLDAVQRLCEEQLRADKAKLGADVELDLKRFRTLLSLVGALREADSDDVRLSVSDSAVRRHSPRVPGRIGVYGGQKSPRRNSTPQQ